ncbi:MAG: hypothetical protein ACJ75B_11610 [Flavisolibacter sp.]
MSDNFSKPLKPLLQSALILIIALILVLTGCKKNDATNNNQNNIPPNVQAMITSPGTPVGNPVSKNIGPAGGFIESPDGRVHLDIPSGALANNTNITIQPITNNAPGGAGLGYDLLPNGTTFSKPAMLRFHYAKEELPDNLPYFLYIAYQDNSGKWIADMHDRDFDSIAKTVSLGISHFTPYVFGAAIRLSADKGSLHARETSQISIESETLLPGTGGEGFGALTQLTEIPASAQKSWMVNGLENGSDALGKIIRQGNKVIYRAPDQIDHEKDVRITVRMDIQQNIWKKGINVSHLNSIERGIDITLRPDTTYSYHVLVRVVDSTLSGFGGIPDIPAYLDTASFDLAVKMSTPIVATASNIKNGAPTVTPAVKTYHTETFSWIADPYGETNITDVKLEYTPAMPADSIIQFNVTHEKTNYPGWLMKGADGSIFVNNPPRPMSGFGIPTQFKLWLNQRRAYLLTEGAFSSFTYILVTPM